MGIFHAEPSPQLELALKQCHSLVLCNNSVYFLQALLNGGKNEGESLPLEQGGNIMLSKTLSNKRGSLLEVIESLVKETQNFHLLFINCC